MKRILLFLIGILTFNVSTFCMVNNKFVVVIDPGHGGRDTGAMRGTIKEKTINLGVALKLGQMIEANHKDVKVVYTRKTDVFVNLKKRSDIANKAKANLFISVHTNSTEAKSTSAAGADTYILGLARSNENFKVAQRENSVILLEDDYSTKYEGFDPKSPESYIIFSFMTDKYMEQSLQLASNIQSSFKTVAKRKDRGVHQAGFLVLRESSMPSVLVELGFINNTTEARFLNSAAGQKSMANAIYSGFKKYKNTFDRMQGDVVRTNQPTQSTQKTNTQINSSSSKEVVYKVQFLTSSTKLANNSAKLKGLKSVEYYVEGGVYKYTYGASSNFQEISRVRKNILPKFKDAFIIRFKDGKRLK